MRIYTLLLMAGAAATAGMPVIASAAPVRAGSALPAGPALGSTPVKRAASPTAQASSLIGFPIALFVGLFTTLTVVVVATSGPRRSPG